MRPGSIHRESNPSCTRPAIVQSDHHESPKALFPINEPLPATEDEHVGQALKGKHPHPNSVVILFRENSKKLSIDKSIKEETGEDGTLTRTRDSPIGHRPGSLPESIALTSTEGYHISSVDARRPTPTDKSTTASASTRQHPHSVQVLTYEQPTIELPKLDSPDCRCNFNKSGLNKLGSDACPKIGDLSNHQNHQKNHQPSENDSTNNSEYKVILRKKNPIARLTHRVSTNLKKISR